MRGIKNSMVMQRNADNVCEIYIKAQKMPAVSYSGQGISGECEVESTDKGFKVTGIPAGGPYTVTADGEIFTDILVGDVYLLAGQSNMEGFGWLEACDREDEGDAYVRAFYQNGEWANAKHPLHDLYNDLYGAHKTLGETRPAGFFKGVGPGVSFAKELKELYGVPQGVIPCAHGGTAISEWHKTTDGADKSLYAAMLERFCDCGSNVAGMYWYQGCEDAFRGKGASDKYYENFCAFADAFFSDFGDIPVIATQIGRVILKETDELRYSWMAVREAQRKLSEKYKNIYLLSSIDAELDDRVHLSRAEQEKMGKIAARAMFAAQNPLNEIGALPPITLDSAVIKKDPISEKAFIYVTYDNVEGELLALSRANGFYLTRNGFLPDELMIYSTYCYGNTVEIRTENEVEDVARMKLYYGYGIDPQCNIEDCSGRALICFGPIDMKTE